MHDHLGDLTDDVAEAIRTARGRVFQRLEFIGDSLLEVILHAHTVAAGPPCTYCGGRADRYTTDAHLSEVAVQRGLGSWLDWTPSEQRLADLVEACAGATWVSGRWPQCVQFVAAWVHPLTEAEQVRILHGGLPVHPQAPLRVKEILGAAILEVAASTSVFLAHPEGDEGDLSRIRARLLSSEHVMSRARDSRWVRRSLRTHHIVRDDIERLLAQDLLGHGLASAVSIAWPLTR